jgi:hypothetical protein
MNVMRFPVSGPRLDATADDYEAEAALIAMEATAEVKATGNTFLAHEMHLEAFAFRRVARMKRWAERPRENADI